MSGSDMDVTMETPLAQMSEMQVAPSNPDGATDSPMNAIDEAKAVDQEATVTRFASLMGTHSGEMNDKGAAEMVACFTTSLSDDAVICTLPSLDMKVTEDGDNPLPAVGQHNAGKTADGALEPIMEASILGGDEASADEASADDAPGQPNAAQQLCSTTSWTKSSIVYAPEALIKNVSKSFSSLVDSRLRSWTVIMLKQSLASGDQSSRANLLKMLAATNTVNSSKSNFRTFSMPASARSQAKEYDVILPLLFEAVLNISIQDRSETVTIRAPGTISGNFSENDPTTLVKVDIRLDAKTVLSSIVDQARLAVFKTVAKVTATDLKPATNVPVQPDPQAQMPAPVSQIPGGFSSSLRLTPTAASSSPRLAKARNSALKLNSVLQGRFDGSSETPAGIRKNRSVQWEHPMELPSIKKNSQPPSPKKPRVAETTARMKSFKSFGRPHAEDTDSGPRNATFGNFGRKPIWGRDGKLLNHPEPVNALERSRQDLMGVKITGSVNATFGAPAAPSAASRVAAASANNANMNRLPSSLPRTATALESWLMNTAGGK